MLSPTERTVLTETLRPPAGYEIDRVITTTYTLDLVTLLTLPLSFTLLAGDGVSDDGRVDPIALLEALRRHAKRITVFCDAGHIAVPRRGELLFGYLERSVVEVRAPRGGAFHPKVTVVRYVPNEADPAWDDAEYPGEEAIRYRLLSSTRNLTFDRSWDTLLVLDGELATSRKNAFGRNRPLAKFIRALPGMTVHDFDADHREAIGMVADELLRVGFELPPGFGTDRGDLAFWPLGIDDQESWPFGGRTDRLLVIAPFIDKSALGWLEEEAEVSAVVSRAEELDQLPTGTLNGVSECFILADAAESEPVQEDQPGTGTDPSSSEHADEVFAEGAANKLRGLHAKLFVADAGWYATVWTGSANATSAAFERNVEFLVELRGKKSAVGIDALLGQSDDAGVNTRQLSLRSMLAPYQPPDEPVEPDQLQHRLERLCDDARRAVVEADLAAHVSQSDDEDTSFDVALLSMASGADQLPEYVECGIQCVSRLNDEAQPVRSLLGTVASFGRLAMESLSSFFAFTVTARQQGKSHTQRFVLNLPLVGAPENRESKLLLAMLSNRERLIRYLLMLLAGPELALRELQGQGGAKWKDGHFAGAFGLPLLEPLLRTLADDPARLADVERLVRDLEATEEGAQLLPDDFVGVWRAIRAVFDSAGKEAKRVHS